jgi:adenosine kinase
VGDDDRAKLLMAANSKEGVESMYLVKKGEPTGVCAAIITGVDRSLVTDLQAASKFENSHLTSPEIAPLMDNIQLVYVEGYFLTHSSAAVCELAQRVSSSGKTFVLNLSAPFIPERFGDVLSSILPYTNIIIANESEAKAWSAANPVPFSSIPSTISVASSIPAIASRLALLPKSNPSKPRLVLVTQGSDSTILVSSSKPDHPKMYPVKPLRKEEIVDTNAAGDAFAGGFLAAYVSGRNLDDCVEVGHKMGAMCVGQVGPNFKWPKVTIL